MSKGEHPFG
jgi:serine/threonine-protein kinase/endoribonuclease IRE1